MPLYPRNIAIIHRTREQLWNMLVSTLEHQGGPIRDLRVALKQGGLSDTTIGRLAKESSYQSELLQPGRKVYEEKLPDCIHRFLRRAPDLDLSRSLEWFEKTWIDLIPKVTELLDKIDEEATPRRQLPISGPIRIRSVKIRGVKSIGFLNLDFFSRDKKLNKPIVIFGENGVGKTTILESISLLAYTFSMTRVIVPESSNTSIPKVHPSWLVTHASTPDDNPCMSRKLHDAIYRITYPAWRSWVEAYPFGMEESGSSYEGPGFIDFEIDAPFDGGRPEILSFGVLLSFPQDYSITRMLGRMTGPPVFKRDYDIPSDGPQWYRTSEWELGRHMAVLYDKSFQDRIETIFDHYYCVSPLLTAKAHPGDHRDVFTPRMESKDSPGVLSYINTDLNDYGRFNCVRESVKDLLGDLKGEILGRLGLTFDKDGNLQSLRPLNEDLQTVIANGDCKRFEITECKLVKDKIQLSIKRDGQTLVVDYLSAGENEVFWIFLLLRGLPIANGFIILDEPDLHVFEGQKKLFYTRLYEVCKALNVQAIISSHSVYALGDLSTPNEEGTMPHYLRIDRESTHRNHRRELLSDWQPGEHLALLLEPIEQTIQLLHRWFEGSMPRTPRLQEKEWEPIHFVLRRLYETVDNFKRFGLGEYKDIGLDKSQDKE
ncbi:MAG: AAA family ATPase [Myxococcales bacterium]|nr:AAA family ATPase [Myxococcales bacterium]